MTERKAKKSEAKARYDREWNRSNMLCIAFRLSRISDQELIKIYESIPNKMEWFRQALRDYGGVQ